MPMELLRVLAEKELPHTVYAPADIDKLRVLRAAELITAVLPPAQEMPGGGMSHQPARVLEITAKGRAALQNQSQDAVDR